MLVIALTTSESIQLAAVVIGGLALLATVGSLALTVINERRRSQPIVIAHEAASRRFAASGVAAAWVVDAYLTSEGGGPAFNVRYGVQFGSVRYPYRLRTEDPDAGNIQRVLKPGGRLPETGSVPILIDSLSLWGRAAESKASGDLDAKRVYWARYENAQNKTWETINPGDRSAKLVIRRVRWVGLQEWRERRARKRAGQHDAEWIKSAFAELTAEKERAEAEAEGEAEAGS